MPRSEAFSNDKAFPASASHDDKTVSVEWPDREPAKFHHIWLRDNCRCEECGMPETGRRNSRLSDIPLDIAPSSVAVSGGDVTVLWADGHQSTYSGTWLQDHAYGEDDRRARAFRPTLWSDEVRKNPPIMDFEAADGTDSGFLRMLQTVREYGMCFLRDAPDQAGALEPFARKIGPVQESNFGMVQDLVVDKSKRSVGNRTIALKPHTDEPYRASPPGILMFHCIETDVTGAGASTFVDGFEAAEILRSEDPNGFAALTRNKQAFRRHFEGDVDLVAEFPIIAVDDFGNLSGVRVNDRVASPLSIRGEDIEDFYRGLKRFLALTEDPGRTLELVLRPGDVAVFDNHRILHGRTELTMKGRRWLQWLQVERGDFHSALRIYADRIGQTRDANPLLRGAYG